MDFEEGTNFGNEKVDQLTNTFFDDESIGGVTCAK